MKPLFDSGLELVVESDFIYFPLLFDPDIEKEIQTVFHSGENTAAKCHSRSRDFSNT